MSFGYSELRLHPRRHPRGLSDGGLGRGCGVSGFGALGQDMGPKASLIAFQA